jgi:hypothetical protein
MMAFDMAVEELRRALGRPRLEESEQSDTAGEEASDGASCPGEAPPQPGQAAGGAACAPGRQDAELVVADDSEPLVPTRDAELVVADGAERLVPTREAELVVADDAEWLVPRRTASTPKAFSGCDQSKQKVAAEKARANRFELLDAEGQSAPGFVKRAVKVFEAEASKMPSGEKQKTRKVARQKLRLVKRLRRKPGKLGSGKLVGKAAGSVPEVSMKGVPKVFRMSDAELQRVHAASHPSKTRMVRFLLASVPAEELPEWREESEELQNRIEEVVASCK